MDLDDVLLPLPGQDQVLRLDVAVDHLVLVGVLQAQRRLRDVMAGILDRQWPLTLHHLVQVLSIDVLYRKEEQFAGLHGAVRLHHVVMAEHGRRADLAQERSATPGLSSSALFTTFSTSRRSIRTFLAR